MHGVPTLGLDTRTGHQHGSEPGPVATGSRVVMLWKSGCRLSVDGEPAFSLLVLWQELKDTPARLSPRCSGERQRRWGRGVGPPSGGLGTDQHCGATECAWGAGGGSPGRSWPSQVGSPSSSQGSSSVSRLGCGPWRSL